MRENDLISVLLPVYNGEDYIGETISSILKSSYTFFEIIIVDDGSTDDTAQVVRRYIKTDNRIKYYYKRNGGITSSLNYGLERCTGDFIARIDSDDLVKSDRLELQIKRLKADPSLIAVGSNVEYIGSRNGFSNLPTSSEDCACVSLFCTPVMHPSVMFRNIGQRYSSDYPHAEDYEFFSRMLYQGKIENISEALTLYRIHDKQISKLHNKEQFRSQAKISYENLTRLYNEKSVLFTPYRYFTLVSNFLRSSYIERSTIQDSLVKKIVYLSPHLGFRGLFILFKLMRIGRFGFFEMLKSFVRWIYWSLILLK